jgi:uncharacterized protein YndB with AHSA1/START domain
MSDKPKFVYVIYIAATPEKVWQALTDGDMSEHYWDGSRLISDWKAGAPFELKLKRHDKNITGTVIEVDAPRRLVYSFHPHHDGVMEDEGPSRVAFEIERQDDQVKLTIVHDGFEAGSKVFEGISRGWPLVLSSLKSYLESGKVLRAHWYKDAAGAEQAKA